MQCRKAVGPTRGYNPIPNDHEMDLHNHRKTLSNTWRSGLDQWYNCINSNSKKKVTLLNSVQRLANILITSLQEDCHQHLVMPWTQ